MARTVDNPTRSSRRWLVIVCVVAAATHGAFYFFRPPAPLSPDEQEYLSLGVGLAERGQFALPTGEVAKRMPLYPVLIAGVHAWQGPDLSQSALLMVQTLLAWCTTIIIALTAERLADGRAGWMAGTVAAFYSPFRFLQMSFLTETLLIFLVALALLLYVAIGLRSRSPSGRWTALVGVSLLIGLGILTRANALLFLVPFAVDAACRAGSTAQRGARVALILVPALACACAWGARNNRQLATLTLSTAGGLNFYLGHNARYALDPGLAGDTDYQAFDRLRTRGLTEAEADDRLYRAGRAYIAEHPWQTVKNAVLKVGVWLRPTLPQAGPLTPVLGLGAVLLCGWRPWRDGRLTGRRSLLYVAVLVAFVGLAGGLVFGAWRAKLLLATPWYVVPVGLICLFCLRGRPRARGLLIGLFAAQLAVAVVFIPLARLRWTVDGILIVSVGVGLSQLCNWLPRQAPGAECPQGDAGAESGLP